MPRVNITRVNPIQESFLINYLKTHDVTKAMQLAGYRSYKTNPFTSTKVQRRFHEMCIEALDKSKKEVSAAVITRLKEIAFSDITDLYDQNTNRIKPVSQLNGRLIKGIKHSPDGSVILTLHDPLKAIELLGKYYSIFTDQLDITTKGEPINQVPLEITFEEVSPPQLTNQSTCFQDWQASEGGD